MLLPCANLGVVFGTKPFRCLAVQWRRSKAYFEKMTAQMLQRDILSFTVHRLYWRASRPEGRQLITTNPGLRA